MQKVELRKGRLVCFWVSLLTALVFSLFVVVDQAISGASLPQHFLLVLPLCLLTATLFSIFRKLTDRFHIGLATFLSLLCGAVLTGFYFAVWWNLPIVPDYNVPSPFPFFLSQMIGLASGILWVRFGDLRKGWLGVVLGILPFALLFYFLRVNLETHVEKYPDQAMTLYFDAQVNGKCMGFLLPEEWLKETPSWDQTSPPPLFPVRAKLIADSVLATMVNDTTEWFLTEINLRRLRKGAEKWGYSVSFEKQSEKAIWETPPDHVTIPVMFNGRTQGYDSTTYEYKQ